MSDDESGAKRPQAGENPDITAAKHAARQRARLARNAIEASERRAASHELSHTILTLPELIGIGTLLTYSALPNEADPAPAAWRLRRNGVLVAYPRIEAPGVLGLHVVKHELDLVPGPFGLAEPTAAAPRMAHESVDVVFVPGIAFDLSGLRLGYGGGYYDRLLPSLRRDCLRIGIAFDSQILDEIPAEEHDERVDLIVTDARVIRPSRPWLL